MARHRTPFLDHSDHHRFAALLQLVRDGKGVGPSFAEIGAAWGTVSKASVFRHLTRLERFGLIRRPRGRARAIEIVRHHIAVQKPWGAVLEPLGVAGGMVDVPLRGVVR